MIIVSPMIVEMHFSTLMNGPLPSCLTLVTNLPKFDPHAIIYSLTFDRWAASAYCGHKQKCFIMHPVCEHPLMTNQHVQPMLTELCPLLVLHDWKAIAGGDNTQAAYAIKVTVNISQDVDMAE